MFESKQDLAEWAIDQFNKYGIKQPEIFTEQEINDACPAVPSWAVKQHVEERDIKND